MSAIPRPVVVRPLLRRVALPARVQALTRPRPPPRADLVSAITNDLQRAVTAALSRTSFILAVAISAVILLSHAGDLDNGPLGKLFPADSTNAFVIWARANTPRFFGAIVFLPAIIDAPKPQRAIFAVAVAAWVIFVPEVAQIEYVAQALALYLYSHVRLRETKLALVAAVAFAYFAGFVFVAPKPPATPAPTPASRARASFSPPSTTG